MIDVCILGSGIAGSTIANLLSKKYSVHIFDKARGPGGRSSNKRLKTNLSFDHGVQYIDTKSKTFKEFIKNLFIHFCFLVKLLQEYFFLYNYA